MTKRNLLQQQDSQAADLHLQYNDFAYNHFHNILRLFKDFSNFLFTTSETMYNHY